MRDKEANKKGERREERGVRSEERRERIEERKREREQRDFPFYFSAKDRDKSFADCLCIFSPEIRDD